MIVVDLTKKRLEELKVKASGAVDAGIKIHLDRLCTYSLDPYDPKNALVFSTGIFAHPEIQGASRAVVSFKSPMTGGFMVSSAGDVGRYISLTGDTAVTLVGRTDTPSVVVLRGDSSGTTLQIFELSDFEDVAGNVFAFDAFLRKELQDIFGGAPFRTVIAGIASRKTHYGALMSVDPDMGVPDVFGRGGAGSVMVRAHNVHALVLGGEAEPAFQDPDGFKRLVGENYAKIVADSTAKYRFSEKDGIGGTILNWAHLRAVLPAYNWQMIYMSDADRERLWEENVAPSVERFRKMFKDGSIRSKTCGERCAVVCKKVFESKKLDYEPITALGSQAGIFDVDKVAELAHLADSLGFDAIEVGGVVAWALELRDRGIIRLDGIRETNLKPFEVDEDTQAEAVKEILLSIAKGELPALSGGIRRGAEALNPESKNLGVYVPFESGGELVPPQYWVPGFLIPLPLVGKFMTYYGSEWLAPFKLGVKAWDRFHRELMLENAGFCRFHRKWAEDLIFKAYEKYFGAKLDLEVERIAARIVKYQRAAKAEAQPPESQRTKDLIATFARLHKQDDLLTDEGVAEYIRGVREGLSHARSVILRG